MTYRILKYSLALAMGYGFYNAVTAVHKKPRLQRPGTEGLKGEDIALKSLNACIEERKVGPQETAEIVCAGFLNFREPWARDFGFACFGLLALGRVATVKDGLTLFFKHQKPNGQLPLKFHSTDLANRYLHSVMQRAQPNHAPLKPRFITAHGTRSLDSVLLIVIAFCEYVEKTEDLDFAKKYHGQAIRALDWVHRYRGRLGLIRQGPFADWADSVGRKGEVLYTNVLWWRAIDRLEILQARFPGLDVTTAEPAELIRNRIHQLYFCDQSGYFFQTPRSPLFASAPNFLAVAWELARPDQAQAVLDYAQEKKISETVPAQVTDRPYPFYQIGAEMWIAGIPTYHTSCSWMWIGAWHAVAAHRAGRVQEAQALYQKMLRIIERDQTVFEVHDSDGSPLVTRLYRSEDPLSWNAAMVLYAGSVLNQESKNRNNKHLDKENS